MGKRVHSAIALVCYICIGGIAQDLRGEEVYARALRPLNIGGLPYFAVFVSRIPNHPYYSSERKRWAPHREKILAELHAAEAWKFNIYEDREYITREKHPNLIADLKSYEPLEKHDDVLLLYELLPRFDSSTPTTLVGMVGFKRLTWESDSTYLLEDRLGLRVERKPPLEMSRNSFSYLPVPHWRSSVKKFVTQGGLYLGAGVQANTLVTDKRYNYVSATYSKLKRTHKVELFNWIYFLAYWHGLLSTGIEIPPGETATIGKEKIKGPAMVLPSFLIAEGYGARQILWEQIRFKPVPVDGKLKIPDKDGMSVTMDIAMMRDFLLGVPQDIVRRKDYLQLAKGSHLGPLVSDPLNFEKSWEQQATVATNIDREIYTVDSFDETVCQWAVQTVSSLPWQYHQLATKLPSIHCALCP